MARSKGRRVVQPTFDETMLDSDTETTSAEEPLTTSEEVTKTTGKVGKAIGKAVPKGNSGIGKKERPNDTLVVPVNGGGHFTRLITDDDTETDVGDSEIGEPVINTTAPAPGLSNHRPFHTESNAFAVQAPATNNCQTSPASDPEASGYLPPPPRAASNFHTDLQPVTSRTAKCDTCHNRNKMVQYQCSVCGIHACKSCFPTLCSDGVHKGNINDYGWSLNTLGRKNSKARQVEVEDGDDHNEEEYRKSKTEARKPSAYASTSTGRFSKDKKNVADDDSATTAPRPRNSIEDFRPTLAANKPKRNIPPKSVSVYTVDTQKNVSRPARESSKRLYEIDDEEGDMHDSPPARTTIPSPTAPKQKKSSNGKKKVKTPTAPNFTFVPNPALAVQDKFKGKWKPVTEISNPLHPNYQWPMSAERIKPVGGHPSYRPLELEKKDRLAAAARQMLEENEEDPIVQEAVAGLSEEEALEMSEAALALMSMRGGR